VTEKAFVLDSFKLRYPDGSTIGPWSFSLEKGRAGALRGPSGSGKTTLLHTLAGLDPDGFGPVTTSGYRQVATPVDLLFEKPFLQILGPSVKDELNSAEASSWLPSGVRKREREWLLEAFSLDSLWDRPVRELSEGERQKLALACLFLRSPSLLLLDQPASCLDRRGRDGLKRAIERVTERGASVLVADPDWKGFTPRDADRLSLFPKASSLPLRAYCTKPSTASGVSTESSDRFFNGGPSRRESGPIETILTFEGLEIRRRGRTVVRDISGRVSRGEIIALVGDNGSGKTSLLLTLAGLLKPGRGQLTRLYRKERLFRRARPALMLQESLWHLSGKQVKGELAWAGKGATRRGAVLPGPLASLLGLEALLERPGLLLSRGEMQRVALAMAMLRNAPLVCLDEPLRFLWGQERKTIGRVFQAARDWGLSLLIASPMEELLPWADQVWRLTRGRMETCRNASVFDKSATPSSLVPSGAP
jgi:energy-coupling factor transport system ATP-binding protein